METIFNQEDLDNMQLNQAEIYMLISMYHNSELQETYLSLKKKKMFTDYNGIIIFNNGTITKLSILLEMYKFHNADIKKVTKVNIVNLANEMQLLFPEGKKPGTKLYWRGSKPEIQDKLEKFFNKYGYYSHEDVIKATENYLKSYQNDMRFMQLLKYFISKKKNVGGELEEMSELMTHLENLDTPDEETSNDWTVNTIN